ncbi:MAG TPA: T9SS type A sorting domain-containing protein, partial [Bacteroidia bacterium]|nr:T9SS type A sorting domain-containing protein [Bacteroidia bacterium]
GGGAGSYLMPTATLLGSPTATQTGNGLVTIKYLHIGGVPPYKYSWSPGGGSDLTTSALSAGTYTLIVTDSNGCSATLSAAITQPLQVLANSSVLSNVLCNRGKDGSAIALPGDGVVPYTYLWSNGVTSNNNLGLSAGSYSVIVTDNNGCMASASVVITSPTALVVSNGSKAITGSGCNGSAWVAASGATPPYKYSWTPGGATTDTINNLCPDNYCCTVTDSNGCIAVTCVVFVTGINELADANQLVVYPNPASDQFTLLFKGNAKGKLISLYNIPGQKIYEQQCNCQSSVINCQSFPDGVYFLKILMDDGSTQVRKLEIVK